MTYIAKLCWKQISWFKFWFFEGLSQYECPVCYVVWQILSVCSWKCKNLLNFAWQPANFHICHHINEKISLPCVGRPPVMVLRHHGQYCTCQHYLWLFVFISSHPLIRWFTSEDIKWLKFLKKSQKFKYLFSR